MSSDFDCSGGIFDKFNVCANEGDLAGAALIIPIVESRGIAEHAFIATLDDHGKIESAEIRPVNSDVLYGNDWAHFMDASELSLEGIARLQQGAIAASYLDVMEVNLRLQEAGADTLSIQVVDNDHIPIDEISFIRDFKIFGDEPDHIAASYMLNNTNFIEEMSRVTQFVNNSQIPEISELADRLNDNFDELRFAGQIETMKEIAKELVMESDVMTPDTKIQVGNALSLIDAPELEANSDNVPEAAFQYTDIASGL